MFGLGDWLRGEVDTWNENWRKSHPDLAQRQSIADDVRRYQEMYPDLPIYVGLWQEQLAKPKHIGKRRHTGK